MKILCDRKLHAAALVVVLGLSFALPIGVSTGTAGGDWAVKKTPLFDVYYPSDLESGIDASITTIGIAYNRCSDLFRHKTRTVIEIVLSPEQTASSPGLMPNAGDEGLYRSGSRSRVRIPFCIDDDQFSMTCVHGLARALLIDCLESRAASLDWFVEGAAWYAALGFDAEASTALEYGWGVNDIPAISTIPGIEDRYLGRRAVQGLLRFAETSYGPDALRLLEQGLREHGSLTEAVRDLTGLEPGQCDQLFAAFLSRLRAPDRVNNATSLAPVVQKGGRYYSLMIPLYSAPGGRVLYFDRLLDSWSLCEFNEDKAGGGGRIGKLASGSMDEFYSSAPYVNRRAAVSAGGDIMAWVERSASGETVLVSGTRTKELLARKVMPFRAVYDITMSPGGDAAVFAGFTARQSDIYLYRWKENRLEQLSADNAEERFPVISPDGKSVYYSRREISGNQSRFAIYLVRISGAGPDPVHADGGDDLHPALSADGKKLVYACLDNGASTLNVLQIDSGNVTGISGSEGGLFPRFASDGKILFTRYRGSGFSLFYQ